VPDHHRTALTTAVVSAISLGLITTFAVKAYAGGTNPATLVFFRILIGAAGGLIFFTTVKTKHPRGRHHVPVILGTSLGLFVLSISYMMAVQYIPLSLAVIIFYTYPLLLLLLDAFTARAWPKPGVMVGFVLAFAGLALALLPSINDLDIRGIALAFMAAIGATTVFTFSSKGARRIGITRLLAVSHFVVLPVAFITVWIGDGFQLPVTNPGWVGLLGASVCYLSGISFQFVAVRFGNPARMAMVFNLEPVVTLIAAMVILNERLQGIQYAGAALVIAAILLTPKRPD